MTICNVRQLREKLGLKLVNFNRLREAGIITPLVEGRRPLFVYEAVREQIKRAAGVPLVS
jgi:hypothetical protein